MTSIGLTSSTWSVTSFSKLRHFYDGTLYIGNNNRCPLETKVQAVSDKNIIVDEIIVEQELWMFNNIQSGNSR